MEKMGFYVNRERLKGTLAQSAQIGTIPGDGLRRLALTDEDKRMRDLFWGWMEQAGLETRVDDFGNMYGRRKGQADLSPIVVGSHLDTQPNGGRFDGILGVLAALEVIRTLNDHNVETLRPIEIVNFTNEEGARFEPPLLGSGGATGVFDEEFVYSRTDCDGKTFKDELNRIGYQGEKNNRLGEIHSFIELHIEQGPVLENEQVAIGAVQGIKGMTWLEIKVTGESGHAGPTPMALRRDALLAVSKLIVHIENKAKRSDSDMSITIGRMSLSPNVVNCIPKEVVFSLDVRHSDDGIKGKFIEELRRELQQIAVKEEVRLEIKDLWEAEAASFSKELVQQVMESASTLGYSAKKMMSGAGHDAKYMNEVAPTCMIFIPSVGGVSHVEAELSYDEDIEKGANVLLHTVLQVANDKSMYVPKSAVKN